VRESWSERREWRGEERVSLIVRREGGDCLAGVEMDASSVSMRVARGRIKLS